MSFAFSLATYRRIGTGFVDEKHGQTRGLMCKASNTGTFVPVCKQKQVTSTAMDSKIVTQMPGGVASQRSAGKYRFIAMKENRHVEPKNQR